MSYAVVFAIGAVFGITISYGSACFTVNFIQKVRKEK